MGKIIERSASTCLLLPEGPYSVRFKGFEATMYLGRAPKICAEFQIISMGSYFGMNVYRWWNVQPTGKKFTNNAWKVGKASNLFREFAGITGRAPSRLDRIPLTELANYPIRAEVITVKENRIQKMIPEAARYSIISELSKGVL